MLKLNSKRAQLIDALVSTIIWVVLTASLLYAFLTNQFPTVAGKITIGVLIILGIFFMVSSSRSYLKNRKR